MRRTDSNSAKLLLFLSMMLMTQILAAQWKLPEKVMNTMLAINVPPEKPRFMFYPTFGYTPETSVEIGVSNLLLFHARQDTFTRLSEAKMFSFVTFRSQYGVNLSHAFYTHKNKWSFLGEDKFQNFPLLYYGIGPESEKDPLAIVDANMIYLHERILREVHKHVYAGLELRFQRLNKVEFEWEDHAHGTELPLGGEGSLNLGLGLGIVYDNRHNVLNVRKGLFAEAGFVKYNDNWGSDYTFTTYFVEGRFFQPVHKDQVLAVQVYGSFGSGEIPFNELALMGGEGLMRGYYLGRYRDRNLIAAQIEYRFLPFPFSRRFGGAAFLGIGSVFPDFSQAFQKPVIAGGAGLRYFLFEAKDIFLRLDLGITKEGIGPYFIIGEAF